MKSRSALHSRISGESIICRVISTRLPGNAFPITLWFWFPGSWLKSNDIGPSGGSTPIPRTWISTMESNRSSLIIVKIPSWSTNSSGENATERKTVSSGSIIMSFPAILNRELSESIEEMVRVALPLFFMGISPSFSSPINTSPKSNNSPISISGRIIPHVVPFKDISNSEFSGSFDAMLNIPESCPSVVGS